MAEEKAAEAPGDTTMADRGDFVTPVENQVQQPIAAEAPRREDLVEDERPAEESPSGGTGEPKKV